MRAKVLNYLDKNLRPHGGLLQNNLHQLKGEPASGEEHTEADRIPDDTGHELERCPS